MSEKELIIFDTPIKYGHNVVNIEIAKLHTRTPLFIPIIIERSRKAGPTILLSAGIHGDEVNGVEIVRQIITKKYNKPDRGMIICIPIVNVFGFLNQDRKFPDGRDLNRSFPGSPKGSLASRFAHHIMTEIVPHVDYVIDYHTGGASRFNFAQIRYNPNDKECEELAKVFGTKFIMRASTRDHSFRDVVSSLGKKVLMFEGGKAMHLDRIVTKAGIEGTMRVLHKLKLRDFTKELARDEKPNAPIVVNSSSWVRAKYSGMFRSYKANGSFVSKGERIGTITDPFGDFEKIVKAKWDGYVICVNHNPIVNQGDALMHITQELAANG